MRILVKNIFRDLTMISFALLLSTTFLSAAPVARTASGANGAAIQATVDQFRADLGGANNGVGGSFISGRREVNWDGVPDNFSAPNFIPFNFFNINSPRGVVFSTQTTFGDNSAFIVSADSSNPDAAPVRFGNIDPSYTGQFTTFSAQRLFIARNSRTVEVHFFIPGTNIAATVNGFGAVFTDVDQAGPTFIKYYDKAGKLLTFQSAPVANNGLSFAGVSFNNGERVARVEIISGNTLPVSPNTDGQGGDDTVAMDDFIYGEPRAAEFHSGDFDGDGGSDLTVFRPSSGEWFTFNSGSNTFNQVQFGTNGDIPVEGDFDGDSRSDVTVFRPSTGTWFRLNSTDGSFFAINFGLNGDRPVAGDYDKDGLYDIAVWRPSSGDHFFLRSSNGNFQAQHWGLNGDIPVMAAGQ